MTVHRSIDGQRGGYLVFDIETVPDMDLYQQPAAPSAEPQPMAPLPVHKPVTIGTLRLGPDYRLLAIEVLTGADERAMIERFFEMVDTTRPRLVSFAGRGFDLPVLLMRALRHGLDLRWYFDGATYRSRSEEGHIDLSEALGRVRHLSLAAAVRLLGLPGKLGIDGSQVEGLYRRGALAAIEQYCLTDVVQTAFLLIRLRRLQGQLTLDAYRRVARGLLDALRDDPRLADLITATDEHRLLLARSTPPTGTGGRHP